MVKIMKANDRIKVHMYDTNGNEIKTRVFDKIFKVYENNGKLGIDWNAERISYICNGNIFAPFESFASSVIFENVETGKLYCFSNMLEPMIKCKKTPKKKCRFMAERKKKR